MQACTETAVSCRDGADGQNRTAVDGLPARRSPGADSQIRTGDLHFTKVLLYQLSYIGARRQGRRAKPLLCH